MESPPDSSVSSSSSWEELGSGDVVAICLATCVNVATALATVHVIIHRKWAPYTAAIPELLVCTWLAGALVTFALSIRYGMWGEAGRETPHPMGCAAQAWFTWLSGGALFCCAALRVYRYHDVLVFHNGNMWPVPLQLVVSTLPFLVPPVLDVAIPPSLFSFNPDTQLCESHTSSHGVAVSDSVGFGLMITLAIVSAALTLRLCIARKQAPNEYRAAVLVSVALVLVVILLPSVQWDRSHRRWIVMIASASAIVAAFCPALWEPMKAYIVNPEILDNSGDYGFSDENTLGNADAGFHMMTTQGLAGVGSSGKGREMEAIFMCYRDTLAREKIRDYFLLQAATMRILDLYVRDSAPMLVPLSDGCRKSLLSTRASFVYAFGRTREELRERMERVGVAKSRMVDIEIGAGTLRIMNGKTAGSGIGESRPDRPAFKSSTTDISTGSNSSRRSDSRRVTPVLDAFVDETSGSGSDGDDDDLRDVKPQRDRDYKASVGYARARPKRSRHKTPAIVPYSSSSSIRLPHGFSTNLDSARTSTHDSDSSTPPSWARASTENVYPSQVGREVESAARRKRIRGDSQHITTLARRSLVLAVSQISAGNNPRPVAPNREIDLTKDRNQDDHDRDRRVSTDNHGNHEEDSYEPEGTGTENEEMSWAEEWRKKVAATREEISDIGKGSSEGRGSIMSYEQSITSNNVNRAFGIRRDSDVDSESDQYEYSLGKEGKLFLVKVDGAGGVSVEGNGDDDGDGSHRKSGEKMDLAEMSRAIANPLYGDLSRAVGRQAVANGQPGGPAAGDDP